MKALTVWQPWASLIIAGAKPHEWRGHSAPMCICNRRIVIHAGARRVVMSEVEDLIHDLEADEPALPTGLDADRALALLRPVLAGTRTLPQRAGLGTVFIGEPKLAADLGFPADSNRTAHQNWGWPISEVDAWAEPIPMRGAQGIWNWPTPAEALL